MVFANNKKGYFNYEILEKYEAGIVLKGTEVKSVRASKISIKESFIRIIKDEVFIIQLNISHYEYGNIHNTDTTRIRKLLFHKKEIQKFKKLIKENHYSLVPLKVYLSNNKIKVEVGIGKGKKNYDKRETLKKKDNELEIQKNLKNYK